MPLDILLAEHRSGDARLLQEAVQASNLAIHLPDALDRIVDSINNFWLTKAQLPSIATSN